MTLPGRMRRADLHHSAAVSLNHVTCPPVDFSSEPAAEPHGVLDVTQVFEGDDGVVVTPCGVRNLLSNKDTQFLAAVREMLAMRDCLLTPASLFQGSDLPSCALDLVVQRPGSLAEQRA